MNIYAYRLETRQNVFLRCLTRYIKTEAILNINL